ncbi:MAG: N-acetylglutaminylglutamine synthetase [Polyangiales bacterium]
MEHGRQQLNEANQPVRAVEPRVCDHVMIDCGWGRLIFGQTYSSSTALAEALRGEQHGQRDIAMYVREPHVALARAPQELFLDPSHTFRLALADFTEPQIPPGFRVRRLSSRGDAEQVSALYRKRRMVPVDPWFFIDAAHGDDTLVYLLAEDPTTGEIIGTVTGVDHVGAFDDETGGSSLWALAVDPQTPHAGVGHALVTGLASLFAQRGRAYLDLSVMHDNHQAISLYEKLGFERVPVFCLKRRNGFNEPLYTMQPEDESLNPYAAVIVREARRRGVAVDVLDAESAYFSLSYGGRSIVCRESLTELTSAIAMSRCDDKRVTRRVLSRAGLRTPEQVESGSREENEAFLQKHGVVVVKPVRGEQGFGVSVGIKTPTALADAITRAGVGGGPVLLEEAVAGEDLRIVVIDYRVVAAAVRRPPTVVADGEHTVRALIEKQSRRRAAATGGESQIPLDEETERCVGECGFTLDDVPPAGTALVVRKAANVHTGGTIHDVTDSVHPRLVSVAKRAAEVLDIPVVGLDLIVPSIHGSEYAIIEANERPGLANHEPQPTVERFVDLLFPQTAVQSRT